MPADEKGETRVKASYRGYTIDVRRERCMAGYHMLYTTIVRDADAFIAEELVEDSDELVQDQVRYMKGRIDAELECEDPWNENGTHNLSWE